MTKADVGINLALDDQNYMGSTEANIKTLGEIFGQESEVAQIGRASCRERV